MGSEMCIRDRLEVVAEAEVAQHLEERVVPRRVTDVLEVVVLAACLLYTSDAADERSSVDLGGRRIIKKKKKGCVSLSVHVRRHR